MTGHLFPAVRRRTWLLSAASLAAGAATPAVWAQEYPTRPVRLLLGFAAGGSGDLLARSLAPEVTRHLGQPLVVENRPGAATNIASEAVAKAAPDGYTLVMGGSFSHAVNPALFGARLPFDPVKDFTPIAKISDGGGQVIVVPASLPVSNLREFIAYAKREGAKMNYASAGLSSPGHIAGAYFNQVAGLDMTHVPYKGASEAVRDLVSGQVQMTITAPTAAMPLVREGRLKVLAITTVERSRFLPDVPGSAEAGLKDFDLDGWYGVWAPAGTPVPIVQKLHAAFMAALADPAVRQRLDAASLNGAAPQSPAAFARFVQDEIKRWAPIVRASGATLG